VIEGFDKLGILVVFNAGVPIYRDDKAEDGQKNSFAKPSGKGWCIKSTQTLVCSPYQKNNFL
jgi:hypothetical protein